MVSKIVVRVVVVAVVGLVAAAAAAAAPVSFGFVVRTFIMF